MAASLPSLNPTIPSNVTYKYEYKGKVSYNQSVLGVIFQINHNNNISSRHVKGENKSFNIQKYLTINY